MSIALRHVSAVEARKTYSPDTAPLATVIEDLRHAIDKGWTEKASGLVGVLAARAERAEAACVLTEKKVRNAAVALCLRQGFGFYDDPEEGGQDAYDISCEALVDARVALQWAYVS